MILPDLTTDFTKGNKGNPIVISMDFDRFLKNSVKKQRGEKKYILRSNFKKSLVTSLKHHKNLLCINFGAD